MVRDRIRNAKKFEFSVFKFLLRDTLRNALPCLIKKRSREDLMISRGISLLSKEFDVVRFLKKARIAEALGVISLTTFERELIPYLNGNLLTQTESIS